MRNTDSFTSIDLGELAAVTGGCKKGGKKRRCGQQESMGPVPQPMAAATPAMGPVPQSAEAAPIGPPPGGDGEVNVQVATGAPAADLISRATGGGQPF
jgi:hypothetical protein